MAEGFRLRVRYSIEGRLAYLSHLETVRSMERVIRRANLPFAVTEGFSPHMKVEFGPALPVGAGGKGEYLDVRLQSYVAPGEALQRLQTCAPANLMPQECSYADVRSDALSVEFPVSRWEAAFAAPQDPAQTLARLQAAFASLIAQGYIEVEKKKGRKVTVKRVEFEGRLVMQPAFSSTADAVRVCFATFQGNEGALRPDKFIEAALGLMDCPAALASLTRTALLAQ